MKRLFILALLIMFSGTAMAQSAKFAAVWTDGGVALESQACDSTIAGFCGLFDDFDSENVDNYERGGHGNLADAIIEDGLAENIIDEEDLEFI